MSTIARAVLEITTNASGVDAGLASIKGKVGTLATDLKGLAGTMGLAFGGAAVVGGLKSLIAGTFEYAENISDLSAKMGVSTDAAQRWKFAADQSGSSIDTVSKASVNLSKQLAGADGSVKESLKAAGLEFSAIRNMKPEDAFNATVAAIAKIPDPMEQARVATELFGNAGAELLPAIRNGFAEVASEASVMSEQTIKDLDQAKDAWEKLGNQITIWTGQAISGIANAGEAVGGWMSRMSVWLTDGSTGLAQYDAAAADLARTQERLNREQEAGARTAAEAAAKAREKAEADAEGERKARASAAAQQRLAEAFQKQVDVLTGKALAREVGELAKQVAAAEKQGGLSAFQYKELGKQLSDMVAKGAVLTPTLQNIRLEHERLNPSIRVTTNDYKALVAAMNMVPAIQLGNAPPPLSIPVSVGPLDFTKIGQQIALGTPPEFVSMGDRLKASFGESLAGLGGIIVGAIQGGGDVARAAGAALGNDIGVMLGKELQKNLTGSLGKLLGGALGPLGSLLGGEIMGWVGGMIGGIFKSNDTKKMREQFAREMGMSPDQLYKDLQSRGAEGQALANQALNVIGRKDIAAQQQWFKDVETFLARQKQATAEVADAVVEAAAREREAIDAVRESYQAKIDDIQSQMDSLAKSIAQEAPEEIMGVIEAQERAALAQLEIQKKALEDERDAAIAAAEDSLDESKSKAINAATDTRAAIEEIFRDPIKLTFDIPTVTVPGGTRVGGTAGSSRPSLFASAGRFLSVTDRPLNVTVISKLNNRIVAREQVQVMGEALRTGG